MEQTINSFVDDLKVNSNIVGIILFGSYARGDNRPDSDIDLIVLLQTGESSRKVTQKDGKTFEIIYTTTKGALDYWKGDLDGCYNIWTDAKILFDKNGEIAKLKVGAEELVKVGKKNMADWDFVHKQFDAENQLLAIKELAINDLPAAKLALNRVVVKLVEYFFDIRQIWTPPTKKQPQKIRMVDSEVGKLLDSFYSQDLQFEELLSLTSELIKLIFIR